MHVAGLVIPVPEEKFDAYVAWAEASAALFREYGCLEVVESWEDDVPDGKLTDFRRAVAAKPGERIVFSWQVWPDKATMLAAEAAIRTDPRFDLPDEVPFDPRRIILGAFRPILVSGRAAGVSPG
jgi:uncharacterized protein YbaA (DUF1428 family)